MSLQPKSRIYLMLVAMGLAVVFSYVLLQRAQTETSEMGAPVATEDQTSLPVAIFFDDKGVEKTLADFKGQVVLVNLWAIWCPPCIVELPELDKLHAQHKDRGFAVVPIAIGKQSVEEVQKFFEDKRLDHLMIFTDDKREVMSKWPVTGVPISFLIDREGNLVKTYEGIKPLMNKEVHKDIEKLL